MFNERVDPTPLNLCGSYTICIRAPKDKGVLMEAEIQNKLRQTRIENDDEHAFVDVPCISWQHNSVDLRKASDHVSVDTVTRAFKIWGALLIVFLIVPALNLSGMIAGRMDGRLSEMGICRAFGATRSYLLRQVLNENLVLTLIGGFIGLLISWGILVLGRNWVFDFFSPGFYFFKENTDDVLLRSEMLFSPWIFLSAFLVCAILNVTSAIIPAWNSLRTEIVYSLNQKK